MEAFEFNKALDDTWGIIRSLNQYIDRVKPWEVAKNRQTDTEAEAHLAEILSYAAGALLQISELLAPFMPETSKAIKETFSSGVVPDNFQPLFPKIYLHTPDPRTKKAPEQS